MLITLLLHVVLTVPPTPAVRPVIAQIAVAEAADVWAPYGVTVDAAVPSRSVTDGGAVLTVIAVATHRSAVTPGWHGPLGAIAFAPGGAPATAITVFLTDIERLVAGTQVLGISEWQWPPTLREQLVGRALGRVLAHEIGHYLLRSPQHATDGLMRPLQLADDLISPSRHRFRLTAGDAAKLEARRSPPAATDEGGRGE
jgi:hypothetical protein